MKLPSNPPLRGICIFDCPEHTHTSPINTSSIVTVDDPLIVMVCGPPALGVVNCSFHLPFVDVVVWEVSPHELTTCIFVPAESIPQKLILFCCCSIMPSLKNEATLVCALTIVLLQINTRKINSLARIFLYNSELTL